MTTTPTRWTSGDHHGVVWPGGIALLDGALPVPAVARLWARLDEAVNLSDFLAHLAEATGRGLLDLPAFAVAVVARDHGVHLAARGGFVARSTTTGGEPLQVTGTGVLTWSETRAEAAAEIRAGVEGAVDQSPDGAIAWRPTLSGVVPADALVRTLVASEETPARRTAVARRAPTPVTEAVPIADISEPVGAADGEEPVLAEPVPAEPPLPEPVRSPADDGEDFGHVWGDRTIAGSVEDAAVRAESDQPERPLGPPDVRVAPPEEATLFEDDGDPAPLVPPVVPPDPSPTPAASTPVPDDFISSVPFAGTAAPQAAATPDLGPPTPLPASPPPSPPPPAPSPVPLGDHDGLTIAQLPSDPVSVDAPSTSTDGRVLAVICRSGHANPPQRPTCRVCTAELDGTPSRVERPALGRVIASSGEAVELDAPVIVGRAPRAARFQGTEVPHLLTIPHQHVSANHVALRIDGWSILAVDLNSTNGTFLRRNGEKPSRLSERPMVLVPGDVIDLGHGIHLRFEELP